MANRLLTAVTALFPLCQLYAVQHPTSPKTATTYNYCSGPASWENLQCVSLLLFDKHSFCLYSFKCNAHWWADTNDPQKHPDWRCNFERMKLCSFPLLSFVIEKHADWLMYVCTVYKNTLVSLCDVSISLHHTHSEAFSSAN